MANWHIGSGALPHGFPNLRVIQRSIADLHKRFPGPALLGLQFPSSLSPAIMDAAADGDPIASAQHIVAAIAHHFHLPVASVVVRFSETLEVPARITRQQNGSRLVEMQTGFMGSRATIAILAHELAHFFLDNLKLRYDDTFQNEILTDTAANYLGAGWSVLNAYTKSVSRATYQVGPNAWQTSTTTRESKLGYLTPEEFGYVLARRCNITNENLFPWIIRNEGKTALSDGKAQFRRELGQPPLAKAGLLSRLKYKYVVLRSRRGSGPEAKLYDYGVYSIEAGAKKSVLFRCPRCTQQLRLPVGVKRAQVTCRNCKEAFVCSS
jgi:hypothetical protein